MGTRGREETCWCCKRYCIKEVQTQPVVSVASRVAGPLWLLESPSFEEGCLPCLSVWKFFVSQLNMSLCYAWAEVGGEAKFCAREF